MKKYRIPLTIGAAAIVGLGAWGVIANARKGDSMAGMAGMDHSATASTSDHNSQDVMFAQMMVPHHTEAIDMSNTLLAKTGVDTRVTALATDIKNAQQPEIDTMNGWLSAWGETKEASGSAMDMSGSMSASDMQALADADGPTASKLFLQQMVEHHKSAIDMAKTEMTSGKYGAAVAMAKSIVSSQTEQVNTMQTLEAQL